MFVWFLDELKMNVVQMVHYGQLTLTQLDLLFLAAWRVEHGDGGGDREVVGYYEEQVGDQPVDLFILPIVKCQVPSGRISI